MQAFPNKWRPSIGMITAAVMASALLLPLVGLLFFRLIENQLVRQTEAELIAQAAMLSSVYARAIEAAEPGAFPVGAARPARDPSIAADERYAPILPALDLAGSPILPRRPDVLPAMTPPRAAALRTGEGLTRIIEETQRTTLAGFRLLDANGVAIAGRGEIGASFAPLPEVRAALAGRFSAVLRTREDDDPPPPLYSISRGTKIRVFVAMPVFVEGHVRGVVYASRTPDNILRLLYRERGKLALAACLIVLAASAIGFVFVRTIARPMRDLSTRAEAITHGARDAIGPLARHGTRELASLAQSFMGMAKRLSDRSDYLSTFANHVSHELKTPLSSVRGAAELLRDAEMTGEERTRFLNNILADAERMSALLDRLRELARADNPDLGGAAALATVVEDLRAGCDGLVIDASGIGETLLPMSAENIAIVLGHLFDNAKKHAATRVSISVHDEAGWVRVQVADDGAGVSPNNRAAIFEPFFTTRRAEGGTGMGLGIARALLRAHGGDIELLESETGARFELSLPRA